MADVQRRLKFTEGDTLPVISGVLKDDVGDVIDITGYTINLNIQYSTPVTVVATLTTPASGEFQIAFSAGDLIQGTYNAEIEVIDDSGDIITASRVSDDKKFQLVIYPEIA